MKSFCTSLVILWILSLQVCSAQSLSRVFVVQSQWQADHTGIPVLQPDVMAWTGDKDAVRGHSFTITAITGMNDNELFYDINGDGILQADEQITAYATILDYIPGRIYIKFAGSGSDLAVFQYTDGDSPVTAGVVSANIDQPMADMGEKGR